jgi:NAD(P)-dependent dehydrogenase (short-subunit alcohol dehydrogenase family)
MILQDQQGRRKMDDLLKIRDRVAIVWGGGAGMGEATVDLLAAAGCPVGVVDIDVALAEKVVQKVIAKGGKALAIRADVREEAEVEAAVAAVSRAFGTPTLSASVVGVALFKPLLEMTAADWDGELARNLRPAFLIGRAVAAAMRKAEKKGALAFVCSISGLQSAASHAPYGAAKAGLRSLVQTMALEWGPYGIRANAVAPGPIRTVRVGAIPGVIESSSRRVPLGRMGEVGEIASALLFLLSDMAGYITGQTIVADGGWLVATPGADVTGPDRPPT